MKITIYSDLDDKGFFEAFYRLNETRRFQRIRFLGDAPLKYTLTKIKHPRRYKLGDIYRSLMAPLKMLFSFDIIVTNINPDSSKVWILAALSSLGKRIVYVNPWPNGKIELGGMKNKLWKRFLSKSITLTSTRVSLESFKNSGYKAFQIPKALNTEVFKKVEISKDRKVRVIYAGSLDEGSGIRELLEMASNFNPEEFNLLIIGSGKLVGEVKLKQKEAPVTYLGEIPNREKMADIYNKSHIFIQNHCQELGKKVFGMGVLEAMSSELPVVTTETLATKEIISDKEDGMLVKSTEELEETLRELIKNPELRKELGKKARERIMEKYSLENISERLYKIFKIEVEKMPFKT
jgi:glycosyltransferase involved in cell wall biosynthesis